LIGPSNTWTLNLHIDIEAPTAAEATTDTPGHTWVELLDGVGNTYTYGFYPSVPVTEFRWQVPSCVRHPDTGHMACKDRTLSYSLTNKQFADALELAQGICRSPSIAPYHVKTFNCTTFAAMIARSAGQTVPNIQGPVGSVGFGCDNPYALYEATNPDAGTKSPPGTPSPTPAKSP
jgi:hypothetical protein